MTERSAYVDALRGFALIGICVVNLPFLAAPIVDPREGVTGLNAAVQALASLLFEGKFFLIFSFLFGVGFSIHAARERDGRVGVAVWGRRMIGLFVIGALHAVLLFPGDILMGYAVLGSLLWLARDWPDARLLKLSGWMVAAAVPILALVALALSFPEPVAAVDSQRAAAMAAYGEGGFGDAVRFRLGELVFVLPFIALFNWPLAMAAICLGRVLGRRGVAFDPDRVVAALRPWRGPLAIGAVVGNIGFAVVPWLQGAWGLAGFVGLAVGGPCLAALYVGGLAWICRSSAASVVTRALVPAGRMSLTNYLGQSIVANLIFMGWGLGLYGTLERPALLALALVNAVVLMLASRLWLRRFISGPDEWLLRSWSSKRWQPFLKGRATTED